MAHGGRHVFLTGPPGIGKTTLIKKVVNAIKEKAAVTGFYTAEVRSNYVRKGFDVVSVIDEESRCPLARVEETKTCKKRPKIGKYSVYVEEFETFVAPIFLCADNYRIFVLDEIGKMELTSKDFQGHVSKLLKSHEIKVFGTIPIQKGAGISFVEKIRSSENVVVYNVTKENRECSVNQIVSLLIS